MEMSENKDVYAHAKSQMRLSEKIAAALPGFRGYKEKELRRESDKLLRTHLYIKLSKAKDNVRDIAQKISDKRYFDVMVEMDRLVAKTDTIAEKVNHATYGYSGFFDAVKINETNLDRMIAYDNGLIDEVNALTDAIDTLKAHLLSGDFSNLKDKIQGIVNKLTLLDETFDKRLEDIAGVTA